MTGEQQLHRNKFVGAYIRNTKPSSCTGDPAYATRPRLITAQAWDWWCLNWRWGCNFKIQGDCREAGSEDWWIRSSAGQLKHSNSYTTHSPALAVLHQRRLSCPRSPPHTRYLQVHLHSIHPNRRSDRHQGGHKGCSRTALTLFV